MGSNPTRSAELPGPPAVSPSVIRETPCVRELVVRGASVWRGDEWRIADVACRDGVIVDVGGRDAIEIDGAGLCATPGFIDLQCNGAMGIDLPSQPERIWELGAALPRWGVTAWLPTIVTGPQEIVERALATLAAGPPEGWIGAVPIGLHLEGPFLSASKRGAHPESLLRAPTRDASAGWSRERGVALVTIAPELDGALDVIRTLVADGVVVSLGHSAATAAQATEAVDAGARWVTHLFNAMSPLHHREPGLTGVALTDERLYAGLIADGVHVHPQAVAIAQRSLGCRLTLVTDAVAALGMAAGAHAFGRTMVSVGDDGVRLADGTLAGSNLSMDQAVRNLIAFTGCPREVALTAASSAPASLLTDPVRGTLAVGARADIVLLDDGLEVVATVVSGSLAHSTDP